MFIIDKINFRTLLILFSLKKKKKKNERIKKIPLKDRLNFDQKNFEK